MLRESRAIAALHDNYRVNTDYAAPRLIILRNPEPVPTAATPGFYALTPITGARRTTYGSPLRKSRGAGQPEVTRSNGRRTRRGRGRGGRRYPRRIPGHVVALPTCTSNNYAPPARLILTAYRLIRNAINPLHSEVLRWKYPMFLPAQRARHSLRLIREHA